MKPSAPVRPHSSAALAPAALEGGWLLATAGRAAESFDSIEAAAAHAVAQNISCVLCVPHTACVLQRFELPTAERSEFAEMAALQLEKVLPYALESAIVRTEAVEVRESSSAVVSTAVAADRVLALAAPLAAQAHWPTRVVTNAQRAAELARARKSALVIHEEHGRILAITAESGIATSVNTLGARTLTDAAPELPALQLAAELGGSPPLEVVLLDARLSAHGPLLAEILGLTVEVVDLDAAPAPTGGGDLQPPQWQAESDAAASRVRIRRIAVLAVAAYAALLILGWMYVGVLRYQLANLNGKTSKRAPRVEELTETRRKWTAFAPAIDQQQYLLEFLYNVCESIPAENLRITSLEQSPREILVQGEAPSAALAYELNERLKSRPELAGLKISAEPPQILPNGRARFRISVNLT